MALGEGYLPGRSITQGPVNAPPWQASNQPHYTSTEELRSSKPDWAKLAISSWAANERPASVTDLSSDPLTLSS
jgi:hypothetical protein